MIGKVVEEKKFRVENKALKLNNGSVVVVKNKGEVEGTFIVTSYRKANSFKDSNQSCKNYCSLVKLDTGYLAFEEPCSRTTDVHRVLSHLSPIFRPTVSELNPNLEIFVYDLERYTLDISLKEPSY